MYNNYLPVISGNTRCKNNYIMDNYYKQQNLSHKLSVRVHLTQTPIYKMCT